jgi:heptaprenyl diphosphate synthase
MNEMKKTVELSMLIGLAVVLNLVENVIPIFATMPGIRIGLANVVLLFILYRYSGKDALFASIIRVILVGILFSGIFSPVFLFSISGAVVSMLVMIIFKMVRMPIFGVSVLGSLSHSMTQLLVAMLILNTPSLIYYLPVLIVVSIFSGIFISFITKHMLKQFENTN